MKKRNFAFVVLGAVALAPLFPLLKVYLGVSFVQHRDEMES